MTNVGGCLLGACSNADRSCWMRLPWNTGTCAGFYGCNKCRACKQSWVWQLFRAVHIDVVVHIQYVQGHLRLGKFLSVPPLSASRDKLCPVEGFIAEFSVCCVGVSLLRTAYLRCTCYHKLTPLHPPASVLDHKGGGRKCRSLVMDR